MMFNQFRDKIIQRAKYNVVDLCYDNVKWFDFQVACDKEIIEFQGCGNDGFDEAFSVHGDIKVYIDDPQEPSTTTEIGGYTFSLQEIYESLFLQAQNDAYDAYNENVVQLKHEKRHHDSCVIDMGRR